MTVSPELVVLDARDLMNMLPHRHPFVMLDAAEIHSPGIAGVGYKVISISDPIFAGHFPGDPIYPGVMLIEAAGQTCGVVFGHGNAAAQGLGYLAGVRRFLFRRVVRPGDRVAFRARFKISLGTLHDFDVSIWVGNEQVANGTLAISLGH